MNSPLNLEAQAYAALREKLIADFNLNEEDDDVLNDTMDGCSSLHDMIAAAIREAQEVEAMTEALSTIIKANQERKKRLEDRRERIRAAVAQAMATAGMSKLPLPDLTISQRMSKPAPKVIDVDALPAWAKIDKITYTADRDAIKQAYESDPEGFSVPGVVITNAAPVLTVRTK